MSSSNGTVLPLYIAQGDPQGIVASVISANPSQTALVVNCPSGTDGSDCGYFDLSITVGPWAAATPPPNLPATGRYDMYMAMNSGSEPDANGNEGFTFSIGCDMTSRTVPSVCTSVNIGGNNEGVETSTFSVTGTDTVDFALASVTVTAGAEKLSAASTATLVAPSTTASGGSTSSATPARGSASGATSATGSAAAPSQTGGAAGAYSVNVGTMGLLALAVAFFTR
ncbi:Hypothetical protein D9617_27g045290 [Elsinoe fawcettii]|nr:Hypothetical protein D9617_27g045290 [Elsinoe fawcettii]